MTNKLPQYPLKENVDPDKADYDYGTNLYTVYEVSWSSENKAVLAVSKVSYPFYSPYKVTVTPAQSDTQVTLTLTMTYSGRTDLTVSDTHTLTVKAAPAAPVTQYGDLWILGRHRVLCGDCTRPEDRALLLDGNKPEILLTDPPYCSGGSKESQKSTGSIGTERKNGKAPKIANDILSTRGYQNLIRGALTDIPCLYAYIFTDWRMWVYLFDLVEAAGFGVKSEIVWDKGTPGMGVGWRSQHELILFGARAATHFDGHKGYGNVLSISRSGNELHPTQKPVELLEKLVDNTDFAKGVYDPFGGSGTTMAACEAHGQPSYLMELTPAYTDVIVKRYIIIKGKEVRYYGKQRTLAAIRAGQCRPPALRP